MSTPEPGTLEVPGATLYFERRGSGPVLLLIPGGAGDAGVFAGLAPHLADRFTVLALDPRGMSRSAAHDPDEAPDVAVWSEDAHRLLAALSPDREAFVLGTSSGAIVALDLLARHPEGLARVVAHEPPLLGLLPEPEPHRALFAEVRDIFRERGAGPAMARFAEGLGGGRDAGNEPPAAEEPTELPPEVREMTERMVANTPRFLDGVLVPFSGSTPDLAALGRAADRLVPAVGRESKGQEPLSGPATRLAQALGVPLATFPGGHLGVVERPEEFAAELLTVLG
ncbi:alpha/beta fold hydrolase [Streptomyces sp. 3MP-14]|uniref:Alpha/beta fold hydrolase n=1 Tax=Streptomyces mimosae TaxID=2586635 RepID=A0A5N5ZSU3_9ACTN|nr:MULTISPECIES: alpha/beta hydrolase [Streptomyces]KAB8158390.1 alpha/beta fold hydrolase [Streptomyces mimosae]KAB8172583.1 alpha/beta fold hydrolase [Streptomyces sp. 3MP-14]